MPSGWCQALYELVLWEPHPTSRLDIMKCDKLLNTVLILKHDTNQKALKHNHVSFKVCSAKNITSVICYGHKYVRVL